MSRTDGLDIVGTIDWNACETCVHARDKEGGCKPLDLGGDGDLEIDIYEENITCRSYEKKPDEKK